MNALRRAWLAASHPRAFFDGLDERPALGPAAVAVAVSGVVGGLAAAVVAARATASDAWLPLLLAGPALVVPYLALLTLLGGLVLMRPAGLDLRAWEIAAWSWVPIGFLAASLTPIALVAPLPAALVAASLVPAWHLWLVWRGTRAHAVHGARGAVVLYGATVFVAPLALVAFTVAILSTLA